MEGETEQVNKDMRWMQVTFRLYDNLYYTLLIFLVFYYLFHNMCPCQLSVCVRTF